MSEQLAMQLAARGNFGAAETVLDAQEKHQHETAEEAKTRAQKMEDKHHLHLARHKVDDKHQEEETREKEAETRARI
jgi:Rod binding domain-containing protein